MLSRSVFHSAAIGALLLCSMSGASAQSVTDVPSVDLIDDAFIADLEVMLNSPVIHHAIDHQNEVRANISQAEIDALDQSWRAETQTDGAQPVITAALGAPASTYLLRAQASSKGLLSEIFVMDRHGLNVAQSSVTSDFWQGDEAKYQRTFPQGAGAVFIDEPEFNAEVGVWLTQVNLTIDQGGTPIGVGTVEVNLSELARRRVYEGS